MCARELELSPKELLAKELAEVSKRLQKEHKRLQRQLTHRQDALKEAEAWQVVHHEGELLQANLFKIPPKAKSLEVIDWELPEGATPKVFAFDHKVSPAKMVDKLFSKAKKLRTAIPHAIRLLEWTKGEIAVVEGRQKELESVATLESLQEFHKRCEKPVATKKVSSKPKEAQKGPKMPYKVFLSSTGTPIWAGKSAKENDILTFHYAHGSDWWLHAHNHAGSHVVIKGERGSEPDEATLRDAAEVALRMSQGKNARSGQVTVTQVKWLRSVKGCPGKVMVSEHRMLRHDLDDARWSRLSKG